VKKTYIVENIIFHYVATLAVREEESIHKQNSWRDDDDQSLLIDLQKGQKIERRRRKKKKK
jgi:hypothetical protein